MKHFSIRKLNHNIYGYIIFSISFHKPLEFKTEIEKYLLKKSYNGRVIIDTLLSIGNSNNRFKEIYFDGSKLILNSIKVITKLDSQLDTFIRNFYYNNFEKLDTSLLTKPKIFKLRKGLTFEQPQ